MPNLFENHPTHAECETEIKTLKAKLVANPDPASGTPNVFMVRIWTEDLEFFEELLDEIEIEALAAEHGVGT